MAEVRAKLNRLDVAPRKVRAITQLISGLPAGEAEVQLAFRRERAAKPVLKLLRSAIANAKVKGLKLETLVIKQASADKGIRLKRYLPRARGMATPLHKDFSNVIIVLEEREGVKSRFTPGKIAFAKKPVKAEETKAPKTEKPKKESGEIKPKKIKAETKKEAKKDSEAKSNPKKMFRRKAV